MHGDGGRVQLPARMLQGAHATSLSLHHTFTWKVERQHALPPGHQVRRLLHGLQPFMSQVYGITVELLERVRPECLDGLLDSGLDDQHTRARFRGGRGRETQRERQGQGPQAKHVDAGVGKCHGPFGPQSPQAQEIRHPTAEGCKDPGQTPGAPDPGAPDEPVRVVGEEAQAPPAEGEGRRHQPAQELRHHPGRGHGQSQGIAVGHAPQGHSAQGHPKAWDDGHGNEQPGQQVVHPQAHAPHPQGAGCPVSEECARTRATAVVGPGNQGHEGRVPEPVRTTEAGLTGVDQDPRGQGGQETSARSKVRERRGIGERR